MKTLALTRQEENDYLNALEPGMRVIETGESEMKGWKGTVYFNEHNDPWVKWDMQPGHDGQISTFVTRGTRRMRDTMLVSIPDLVEKYRELAEALRLDASIASVSGAVITASKLTHEEHGIRKCISILIDMVNEDDEGYEVRKAMGDIPEGR